MATPATRSPAAETPGSGLLQAASRPETTPFDFIIVGSGAGGGPLAARLALGGKRVLVLEAGLDPAKEPSREFSAAQPGEVHNVPGYHAAATEDAAASWQFSVRHFKDRERQRLDHKYDPRRDPSSPDHDPSLPGSPRPGPGAGGVFYPRSAGLGGCTGHHAMIVAAPNDRDWERIADLTGDDSWRAEKMRSYFTKIEKCQYLSAYYSRLDRLLGPLIRWWRWLVHLIMPRHVLDQGGHGSDGWQPTSFISPLLIETIAKRDHTFLRLLRKAITAVVFEDRPLFRRWRDALFRFRLLRQFDPNDRNTRNAGEKGVFLIPSGIGGAGDTDEANRPMLGRRAGVREFLLKTARDHPDRLVIQTGFHVSRLAFAEGSDPATPEVIGVIGFTGSHLYDASPLRPEIRPEASAETAYFARSEVILCGGAFNTPQLLMLSGIGPESELQRHGIPCRVHLPGVGRNLQDRYEVAVISELADDFKTLLGVSFTPGDPNDPARAEWLRDGTGLYATNGGTLAITLRTSAADSSEPDIFAFGAPAAFRGYYWGWSRELLSRTMGAEPGPPRLWSWIILKAYTRNESGSVTLRSPSPLDTPEIDFRSFEATESDPAGPEKDLRALEEAVGMVRRINHCNPELFRTEIQPGPDRALQSQSLQEWIRHEAWGHHACGTCRMGSDAWQSNPAHRHDRMAVLDSSFRVHGVRRLRVVDASIFPRIPGYFILTPILMASEKAADVILEGGYDTFYPRALETAESHAVARRRHAARLPESQPPATIGLALSGGGVRCATFSLGVIQSLARLDRLREIDFLSSVSGGGFTGAFLGRLFTRPVVAAAADPVGRVQAILSSSGSGQVGWLRSRANYIFSSGSDSKANAGILWRNLFTVHVLIGILLLSLLGSLAWISKAVGFHQSIELPLLNGSLPAIQLSFWWWVPGALLISLLLPLTLGYWLAPKQNAHRAHPPFPFAAWLLLLFASTISLAFPSTRALGAIGLIVLGVAWVAQEFSRWYLPARGPVERAGVTVRNRLSRMLGDVLVLFAGALGWVVLDSLARTIADPTTAWRLVQALMVLAPVLIMLRNRTEHLIVRLKPAKSGGLLAAATAVLLGAFVVLVVDVVSHVLFQSDPVKGLVVVGTALIISLVLGRETDLLNLTSLHTAYAARLIRTYLGSSNPDRIHRITTQDASPDIQQTHPEDDVPWHQYHPEHTGGPLHLINVCVNETVDAASQLDVPDRRGMAMCIGPIGVSVGRRFHGLWAKPSPPPPWQRRRCWLEGREPDNGNAPTGLDPIVPRKGEFHVLQRQLTRGALDAGFDHDVPLPERLTLGTWMAISGSAFSTGVGRRTNLAQSFTMGFVNLRLGYWWNSSIAHHERPGKYPDHLWRRIKRIPVTIFRMQMLLLSEWIGRYHGPNRLLWHLSDGGHFEVTGAYELIRRRVGLVLCVDGAADPAYTWESLAVLGRTVRQDFGAEIVWLDPADQESMKQVPGWIFERIARSALASLATIGRSGQGHAAMARVEHQEGDLSWLVVIKPSMIGGEPRDVVHYAEDSAAFPQEPTIDQVFEDAQWESYRALGQTIATRVFLPHQSVHVQDA